MNALGVDVTGLDVEAFLEGCRRLFPWLALAWLGLVLYTRRAPALVLGVVLANGWAWWVTTHPLQQLYAFGAGSDRQLNLGLVQVVAAAGSPLRTAQVGELHFEPFWGLFVALLSGWNPERVLAIYPFLPLLTAAGFAASLYLGLRPAPGTPGWSPWERALVAGFATLLSSAPLEWADGYRVPWALTFLLKPNHALGLVLLPWLVWGFSRIDGWRSRLAVGLLLHLLGWVFVLHMVYVCFALLVYALISWVTREPERRRDAADVAAVIGINLAVVSPYLVMLLIGYPFLVPSPRQAIPLLSPHLVEGTLRHGVVFLLGLWGAWVSHRRGGRQGRVWAALVVGAVAFWIAYAGVGLLQLARERDEAYYWVRFVTAASAAVGAWDLAERLAGAWPWLRLPAQRAVAVALLALPASLPYWWNPAAMDSYFSDSIPPLPDHVREPTDFIRSETSPSAVFAGDPAYARFTTALGARRVLTLNVGNPSDPQHRADTLERLVRDGDSDTVSAASARYGITHLLVDRALLERYPGATLDAIESRSNHRRIYLFRRPRHVIAIFELLGAEPGAS